MITYVLHLLNLFDPSVTFLDVRKLLPSSLFGKELRTSLLRGFQAIHNTYLSIMTL